MRELERRGARVLVAPTIRLMPARSAALTAALKELAAGRFDWITLTSAATVEVLRERLASPRDVRAKVAVIGEGTAAAFRRWARRDPGPAAGDLHDRGPRSRVPARLGPRPLRPRRHRARGTRGRAGAAKGWETVRVDAYRTVFATSLPREARDALPPRGRRCRDVHERVHGPRLHQRALGAAKGTPEGRVHRPGHGRGGSRRRPATRGGCEAAHARGPRRGPRADAPFSVGPRPRPRATPGARSRRRPWRSARPSSRARRASG